MSAAILPPSSSDSTRRRTLFIWLGLVTFFQAYSSAVTAVSVPGLKDALRLGDQPDLIDVSILLITLGAMLAGFVGAIGDRIGRHTILLWSTASFAALTGVSAAAQSIGQFQTAQMLARIFLTAAYAAVIVIAAEEFPTSRRGRAIGSLTALSALGAAFAISNPVLGGAANGGASGWRGLYLIGLAPLAFVILTRRSLSETRRFEDVRRAGGSDSGAIRRLIEPAFRAQLLQVGAIFFSSNFALFGTLTWWVYYASRERGLSEATIGVYLLAAYIAGALGSYVAGRLQDLRGRRRTGSAFLAAAAVGGIALFGVRGSVPLLAALVVTVFFGLGSASVSNAYAAELFPTEVRITAVALSRGLFGTLGGVVGPLFMGILAGTAGTVGSRAWVVALFFFGASGMVLLLPETGGRELETIAAGALIPSRVTAPYKDLFRPD